jgi:hypothetical protein
VIYSHLFFAGCVNEITLHPRPASRSFAGNVETDHPHANLSNILEKRHYRTLLNCQTLRQLYAALQTTTTGRQPPAHCVAGGEVSVAGGEVRLRAELQRRPERISPPATEERMPRVGPVAETASRRNCQSPRLPVAKVASRRGCAACPSRGRPRACPGARAGSAACRIPSCPWRPRARLSPGHPGSTGAREPACSRPL